MMRKERRNEAPKNRVGNRYFELSQSNRVGTERRDIRDDLRYGVLPATQRAAGECDNTGAPGGCFPAGYRRKNYRRGEFSIGGKASAVSFSASVSQSQYRREKPLSGAGCDPAEQ